MDPVLRSSSLRQALLPLFVLWSLLGAGVWFFAERARTASQLENASEVEEDLIHRTEMAAEHTWASLLRLDPELEPAWHLAGGESAAEIYLRAVETRLVSARDPAERRALEMRRFLLRPELEPGDEVAAHHLAAFSWAAAEILLEEVPDPLGVELEEVIEGRFEALEEEGFQEDEIAAFWAGLGATEAVELFTGGHLVDEEDESLCWLLLDDEDELFAGNVESFESVEELRNGAFLVTAWLPEEDREGRCMVRELPLADGSQLSFGLEIEPNETLHLARNLILLFGLLIVGVGSYWLAGRPARFVRDLERARKRLEDGDSMPRLRRARDGSDFDRAAFEINTILARLDGALVTLTQVTDDIAHDLRTPLTRLQGQLDLLRRSREPTEEMIAAVQEEADQLLTTFNALLRIAQVESGSRKKGFRPFDLRQVVEDVADLYAPVLADHGLTFRSQTPASPLEVQGDPDLWMQALSNLLDNALKYTPEEGTIGLFLTGGGAPKLRIRDSGPGIPDAEQPKVFQRFYRMDQHRGERGSGLGLSLVAAICELHGATIRLRNEGGLVVDIELASGSP